jgi:16S rRNA (adenine1518-N6/adenine1519-N6)-dimethyltransferase
LRIDIYPTPQIKPELLNTFFKLIKAGFSQKRKTLRNSLSAGLHISPADAADMLTKVNIDPQRRAETLDLPEWSALAIEQQARV